MEDAAIVHPARDTGLLGVLRSTPPFGTLPQDEIARLHAAMTRQSLRAGQTLFEQGERGEALYVVISGHLTAGTPADGSAVDIGPRGLAGEMQILTGGRHSATLRASVDTELGRLDKAALEALAQQAPHLVLALGHLIRKRLSQEQLAKLLKEVFGELDPASLARIENELEWVELRPGQALFQQGDPSDSMYFVISGRLVGTREVAKVRSVIAEIGRGESIGEMGFFTGEPRSLAIYARRTSHLVRFTKPVFERVSQAHPHAMLYITQLLIRRLQRVAGYVRETFERSNIVVLPISPGVNATEFTDRLVESLHVHGKTLYVSAARLDAFIGVPGFAQTSADSPLDLALDAGLDERESGYRYAVYECDAGDTAWTRRCIERADRVLLLGEAAAEPAVSSAELALLGSRPGLTSARRTLVLLHPGTATLPSGTRFWLAPRAVEGHHHLRRDRVADYARLVRFLTGNAIGAVLGGGGARGLAHIGVIRAFREAGIPIDMVGGTSMGALIAAQPAMGWDDAAMLRMNRSAFVENKPVKLRDYTLPVYALLDCHRLDRSLMTPYGEARIEDMWTSYFCVSSSLTRAQAKVHRDGPVWKAIRASIAVPGVFEPVVDGNELLVDGGVLNNLPGDVMRSLGGGWVVAVDVSLDVDLEMHMAALPSPWRVLRRWMNPFVKRSKMLNIVDLMTRTTLLASVQKTEVVKKQVDLYIQPPVRSFGLLQFDSFDAIAEAGYQHGKTTLAQWLADHPQLERILREGG